eukprot:TRINITY_DN25768_c0_g1_i2.p1 TRINITY_DN25768_c0_g1~~TRINITY_DN25768_c0_g1_i2.p1  ORF type:complete len:261 (-),score=40.28 TRINITY_DN25768_c0_g1_i2:73-855(-)
MSDEKNSERLDIKVEEKYSGSKESDINNLNDLNEIGGVSQSPKYLKKNKSKFVLNEPVKDPEQRQFGRWTSEEHAKFLEAIEKYGNSWSHIWNHIKSRTKSQIRSHSQKYFKNKKRIELSRIQDDPSHSKDVFLVIKYYWNVNSIPSLRKQDLSMIEEDKERVQREEEKSEEEGMPVQPEPPFCQPTIDSYRTQLVFLPVSLNESDTQTGNFFICPNTQFPLLPLQQNCLLYTSDAADDTPCVDLGGRRIIKKKKSRQVC